MLIAFFAEHIHPNTILSFPFRAWFGTRASTCSASTSTRRVTWLPWRPLTPATIHCEMDTTNFSKDTPGLDGLKSQCRRVFWPEETTYPSCNFRLCSFPCFFRTHWCAGINLGQGVGQFFFSLPEHPWNFFPYCESLILYFFTMHLFFCLKGMKDYFWSCPPYSILLY